MSIRADGLPRYVREIDGDQLLVTGKEHAQFLGYDPTNSRHRGQPSVRTIAFSARSEELYFKHYSTEYGFITYRFLESGFDYLVDHELGFGDELTPEQVTELRNASHIYTEGEGTSGPTEVEVDVPELLTVQLDDKDDDNAEELVSDEVIRQLLSHHFVEMMIHVAGLQEDAELELDESDDELVTKHSRSLGRHYAQLRELLDTTLAQTRFDAAVGENGYQ